MIAPLISIHSQKIIVAWIIPRFTPCVHGCQPPSLPACPAKAAPPALGEHCISRHACPSSPHENTHTILTRSFGWLADIILVIMRIHMHQEALYIYIYTYTHTHRHTCCMQRRVRKQAARVIPFSLPRPFPFERQSRHAMIFHFPRHPPWNTSTPVVERGLKSIRPSRELESPVGGYRDGWSDRLPFIRILAGEGNIFKPISRWWNMYY